MKLTFPNASVDETDDGFSDLTSGTEWQCLVQKVLVPL